MSTWMRDIFNRTHPGMGQPAPQATSMPAPTPAPMPAWQAPPPMPAPTPTPPNPQGAMGNLMSNFPQPVDPQGAMGNLMSNFPSAPQGQPNSGMDVMQVMQTKPPGVDPKTWLAVCGGTGMQQPAGTGQTGFRTANGDTGLQGANMPQPSGLPWLPDSGLNTSSMGGNDNGWLLPSMGSSGGGGMGGAFGAVSSAPQPSGPFTYGMFGGGAPQQGGPQQMPAFQAPPPMPFMPQQPMPGMPQQPMPGMQPYNFSQQMGQTAPPSPMNGQMKGMFGVR